MRNDECRIVNRSASPFPVALPMRDGAALRPRARFHHSSFRIHHFKAALLVGF
jgi:hypothetical protein